MPNNSPTVRRRLSNLLLYQLPAQNDQEDVDNQLKCIFNRNVYKRVMQTYSEGRQIAIDERLTVRVPTGSTLADTMTYAIGVVEDLLYYIWPRSRELRQVTNMP